jgi:CRP-like cAMP-binding protein
MAEVRTYLEALTALEETPVTVEPGGVIFAAGDAGREIRSASAVAGPDCTLVRVDQAAFDDLVRRVPGLALEVMRVMARRLRKANPK